MKPENQLSDEALAELRASTAKLCDEFGIADPFHRSIMEQYTIAVARLNVISNDAAEHYNRAAETHQLYPAYAASKRVKARSEEYEEARATLFACKFLMEFAGSLPNKDALEARLAHFSDIAYSDYDLRQFDREMEGSMRNYFLAAHRDLQKEDIEPQLRPVRGGEQTQFTRRRFITGLAPVGAAMAIGGAAGGAVESVMKQKIEPTPPGVGVGISAGYAIQLARMVMPTPGVTQKDFKKVVQALRGQYANFCRFELDGLYDQAMAQQQQLIADTDATGALLRGFTTEWPKYVHEGEDPDQQPHHAYTWVRHVVLGGLGPIVGLDKANDRPASELSRSSHAILHRLQKSPAAIENLEKALVENKMPSPVRQHAQEMVGKMKTDISALQETLAAYHDRANTMANRGFGRRVE